MDKALGGCVLGLGVLAVIAVALAAGTMVLGYPSMLLWNSFVPEVFGVGLMTYWQSVCMLWFSWIVSAPIICMLLFVCILSAAAMGGPTSKDEER